MIEPDSASTSQSGDETASLAARLERLTQQSVAGDYNAFTRFEWIDKMPEGQWWMSKELLSVYDTPMMETLSETQLKALSKWESINFYSLNIHGIRELLVEIARRLHAPGYEVPAEFFHRFLGEENDHMWFFAQFCRKYGKIYPDKSIKFPPNTLLDTPDIDTFFIFCRILIFEEIVDQFNMRMGRDESLHPLIQKINAVHHEDESRHIAGGREIIKQHWAKVKPTLSAEQLTAIDNYLKNYLTKSVESLYNAAAYQDAGIPEPFKRRNELFKMPARKKHHRMYVKRSTLFLHQIGALSDKEFTP
jgi:hypothetical protein